MFETNSTYVVAGENTLLVLDALQPRLEGGIRRRTQLRVSQSLHNRRHR